MIGTMNKSETLDKALNFNSENIFEYIDILLFNQNTQFIGDDAEKELSKIYSYIEELELPDTISIQLAIEDIINSAMNKNSYYAFRAGFIEGCRLLKTLQSF